MTATRALVAGTWSLPALARARVVTSALVAGAALLALPLSPAGPGWLREAVPVLAPLVLFFVLAGWESSWAWPFAAAALEWRRPCSCSSCAEAALLAAAVALFAGSGLVGIAWSQAVSPVPALVLGGLLLARRPARVAGAHSGVGSVLRAALPMAAHGGLQMLSPRVEFLVLSVLARDRGDGHLPLRASGVRVPGHGAERRRPGRDARAHQGSPPGRVEGVRRRTAATLALVAAPAAIGLALVAQGVVGLLFGAAYADGAAPLRVLAIALLPLFMNALLRGRSWRGTGRPGFRA